MRTALTALAFIASAQVVLAQTTITAALTGGTGPLTRAAGGLQTVGQSFVAPTATARLNSFSLSFSNFFNGSALRFDAYLFAFDAANRRVSGNALWSSLNVAGSSNDFDFDTRMFTVGVDLVPSSTFIFFVTTSTQGTTIPLDASNLIGTNDTNGYTLGSFWAASNGMDLNALRTTNAFSTVDGITDAAFSANFGVVPEPSSVVLTATGLAFLLLRVRRRRASREM
jgi:hypothetical protein